MGNRITSIAALVALALLGGDARAAPPALLEKGGRAFIMWEGDKIVDLAGYRRLRFRSNGRNDRWLGVPQSGMDLAWSYSDVNDYVLSGKTFTAGENSFVLEIEAAKPSVLGTVRTRLEGKLVSPEVGFQYKLSSRLTARQKEWREVSKLARGKKPSDSLSVEPLDYHIHRVSQADLFEPRGVLPGVPELYDGFVVSSDGKDWEFVPKIPVPQPARPGTYPAVEWNLKELGRPGHRVGVLDRREGGWMSELVDASAPLKMTVCWMFYDLHHIFPAGVPPWVPGKDTFEARYALTFTPVLPGEARELLDRARPIEWRSLPEYRLPVFSRYTTFDRMLSGNSQYAWLATSYQCAIDSKVGYDDNQSIRIGHDSPGQKSAWYAWTWGPCFDSPTPLDGTYRFSVMVKTEACTSPFRLAVAEFLHDLWPRNGKWITNPGKPGKVLWHYSKEQVSGTSDWTELSIDLPIDNEPFKPAGPGYVRRGVVLEYEGKGTIWFDNVRIEKVE